jgi:pimeloyl-[acyl-carrier protein] synthase
MLRLLQWLIRQEWAVRLLNPLIGKFNPFLPEFRADPYPFYRALRASNPVYFSPALRGWILTRYADIAAVLHDPRFSVNRQQSKVFQRLRLLESLPPDLSVAVTRNLLMLDPPDHTRLRRLVNKAFTPRRVETLRPRIQLIVDELLDALEDRPEIDLIHDFAYPLPVIVIAEMLGVPAADRTRFKRWSDELVALLDPLQAENGLRAVHQAFSELCVYFREIFAARRRQPQDDLVSALVAVEEQGDALNEPELLSLCMLLLGAGNETTTNLIANAVLALLRHPDERRRLLGDASLMGTAIEEFLRFDSPIQVTDRVATQDCQIDGRHIRKGELVGLVLGAANRDPQQFANPDRLDVGRQDNDHLAFGRGTHFCLGAALARAEAEIALPALLHRFPRFDGALQPPGWKRSLVLRGPTALALRLQ